MNRELLLQHLHRLSGAPDALPRLRQFILDLAVRGKLVAQDRSDEPASKLLGRIRAEKATLLNAGGLRKEKPLYSFAEDELPFRIPKNWLWTQLAEIGFLNPRNSADDSLQASFVPMPSISAEYGVPNAHDVRLWSEIKTGYTHFAEGDVALAKITPCFENGKSTVFRSLTGGLGAGTTELHVVRPILVSADYILIFLKCPHFIESGVPKMTGTAGQKRVPSEYFAHSPFPLPPLTEQHRIVAKVGELMTLCDQLEAAQQEQENRRDRLTSATLYRLNDDSDANDLHQDSRFFITNLARFTVRPDQIKSIRQTVLGLAVRGRLARLDGGNPPPPNSAGSSAASFKPFDVRAFSGDFTSITLPAHWLVEPLMTLASTIVDCPHSTPKWTSEGRMCVRTNQFRPGYLDLSDVRFVSESTYLERIQRLTPMENDVLYSREGGILGVACRIPPDTELCLGQRMMLIRSGSAVDAAYLEMVLNSPLITGIALQETTGGAAPRVNVATVKAYPIPVPPLPEQRLITTKVAELMIACEQLETQLTTKQTESIHLLEAILHEALSPLTPVVEAA